MTRESSSEVIIHESEVSKSNTSHTFVVGAFAIGRGVPSATFGIVVLVAEKRSVRTESRVVHGVVGWVGFGVEVGFARRRHLVEEKIHRGA